MKKNIHPKYQTVLFVDSATGQKFLCGTTLTPDTKEKYEGKEYPTCYLPTSSLSHPFFTGSNQLVDAEGRVEKFKNRYIAAQQKSVKKEEHKEAPKKESKKREAKAK